MRLLQQIPFVSIECPQALGGCAGFGLVYWFRFSTRRPSHRRRMDDFCPPIFYYTPFLDSAIRFGSFPLGLVCCVLYLVAGRIVAKEKSQLACKRNELPRAGENEACHAHNHQHVLSHQKKSSCKHRDHHHRRHQP